MGKHPQNNLTAAKVRALKDAGRYSDGNGLYLEVDQSGAKRWVQRLIIKGKRRDIGHGGITTVTLADARKKAIEYRTVARSGGDPVANRNAQQGVPTFEEAARRVHSDHMSNWKNAKHRDQWLNTLESFVFPFIGSIPVNKIDSSDILRVLSPIWLVKPETARRVRQRIRTVFDWAHASNFRSGINPTDGIQKALPRHTAPPNHHAALPYDEVSAFIGHLRQCEAEPAVKLAFEFLILTATRTSEVLNAEWSEISGDTWTIPASRMKGKLAHRVPLPERCQEILQEVRRFSNGAYIFPGRKAKSPLSNMALLQVIKRMGLKRKVTAHGFRSSFKDWATELTSFPQEVSEAALSHSVRDKTVAAYQRGDIFAKRRKLMEEWQCYLKV